MQVRLLVRVVMGRFQNGGLSIGESLVVGAGGLNRGAE
jgi:hypothetical protein